LRQLSGVLWVRQPRLSGYGLMSNTVPLPKAVQEALGAGFRSRVRLGICSSQLKSEEDIPRWKATSKLRNSSICQPM
jgi:hypothetical protein